MKPPSTVRMVGGYGDGEVIVPANEVATGGAGEATIELLSRLPAARGRVRLVNRHRASLRISPDGTSLAVGCLDCLDLSFP